MKKIIMATIVLLGFYAGSNGQVSASTDHNPSVLVNEAKGSKKNKKKHKSMKEIHTAAVSSISKESFNRDFTGLYAEHWNRTKNFDEVTFHENGVEMKGYYDWGGKLVGTTQNKTFNDIPMKAQKEINDKYANFNKAGVVLFDDNEYNETDMVMYGTSMEDADNYFVELSNGKHRMILKVNMEGEVSFFKQL